MNAGKVLPRGTLCFLTRVQPSAFKGRVVEVVGGPRDQFSDEPGPFYEVAAPWLREMCEPLGKDVVIVVREQLVPILPDPSADAIAQPRAIAQAREVLA